MGIISLLFRQQKRERTVYILHKKIGNIDIVFIVHIHGIMVQLLIGFGPVISLGLQDVALVIIILCGCLVQKILFGIIFAYPVRSIEVKVYFSMKKKV